MNQPGKGGSMPQPRRGEVWLVAFPNRPNDPHLPRPAIVLSNNHINEFAEAVLVVPVSNAARGRLLPTHVFIEKGTGNLDKDSRALCEQIVSVNKSRLGKGPIGDIPSAILTSILLGLKKAVE